MPPKLPPEGNPLVLTCGCGRTKHALQYKRPVPPFEAHTHLTLDQNRELAEEYYRTTPEPPGVCLVCVTCDSVSGAAEV